VVITLSLLFFIARMIETVGLSTLLAHRCLLLIKGILLRLQ
jgi:hypothetical protein